MTEAKRKRATEDEKFFWRRYDLTTRLCGMAPYNRYFGPGDKRNYSINKVGELAEKILRGEVPNPLKRR